ncbi:sigma-70 family RNA polymerase sigma factor [Alkalibaculum sporogenes]|uniref:sigma-70 family RNA polymerase sigma factor n=1 Tax=Alkalibaculum sporogenes TaxID=2655001 RepID=UPI00128B57FD
MNFIILEELVKEIKTGNKGLSEQLIIELKPLILYTIKKYGYYDTFEENYQSAMVVLFESIKEFDPLKGVTFAAYYKSQLFYYFMNIVKKEKDHIDFTQETSSLDQIPEEEYKTIDSHVEDIIWREERTKLYAAIKKLRPRQKWLIESHYFQGKKLIELSKEYNLNYQGLVKLKARSLITLKEYLQKPHNM